MDVKLVVVGGDAKATEIKLRLPTLLGRGREANVVLPHPLVSRRHCEIFVRDGMLFVRDLDSLNGTYINNQRIGEAELPPGNLLTLGTVTFRAVYEAAGHAQPTGGPTPPLPPLTDDSSGGVVSLEDSDLHVGQDEKTNPLLDEPPREVTPPDSDAGG